MKIEQKNTLLIISLVLLVLGGVAGSGFLLIRDHVTGHIDGDLGRAQTLFEQTYKNRSQKLQRTVRSLRKETGLIAAALTDDIATIDSKLDTLYPRVGVDFVAVYLTNQSRLRTARGNQAYYSSPQFLNSNVLAGLTGSLGRDDKQVFANTFEFRNCGDE